MLRLDMIHRNCHDTLRTSTLLAQKSWQLWWLQHCRRAGNTEGQLIGVAGNKQRCPPGLQNISNGLERSIARVIGQQNKTARNQPIGCQCHEKTRCSPSAIDRALSLLIYSTKIAEALPSQKSLDFFGQIVLSLSG